MCATWANLVSGSISLGLSSWATHLLTWSVSLIASAVTLFAIWRCWTILFSALGAVGWLVCAKRKSQIFVSSWAVKLGLFSASLALNWKKVLKSIFLSSASTTNSDFTNLSATSIGALLRSMMASLEIAQNTSKQRPPKPCCRPNKVPSNCESWALSNCFNRASCNSACLIGDGMPLHCPLKLRLHSLYSLTCTSPRMLLDSTTIKP